MRNPAKTAQQAFSPLGTNFFTSLVIERESKGGYFYELSTNQSHGNSRPVGLPNNGTVPGDLGPMYGVSVMNKGSYEINSDKSDMFSTLEEARAFIEKL